MPLYEYRCPTCRSVFEQLRPINRADEQSTCPRGHSGGQRVVSLVASRAWGDSAGAFDMPAGGGCACGGGACACAGH